MSIRFHAIGRWAVQIIALGLAVGFPRSTVAQSETPAYLDPDYRNRIYTETPIPSTLLQAEFNSIAITSGHVGRAGDSTTPNSSGIYLVRSVIGQPVAGNLARILGDVYKFGQPIVPDSTLGVNANEEPEVAPEEGARWIPGLKQLIAASPGFVDVKWKRLDGSVNSAVRYQISSEPFRDPVHLYHSHGLAKQSLTFSEPIANVPSVTLPTGLEANLKWNAAIPKSAVEGGKTNTFVERNGFGVLESAEKTGLILVEFIDRQSKAFKGLEIVKILSPNEASVPIVGAHIGDRLLPVNITHLAESVKPKVRRGYVQGNLTSFAYQHEVQGALQDGEVYAVRATRLALVNSIPIEVFWLRRSLNEIVWPYELTRYSADWPKFNPEKYQIYARDAKFPKGGPSIDLPQDQKASVMPFREPDEHVPASEITATEFWTTDAGWSLLKFTPGNSVAFQVVRSVLHTDNSVFSSDDWPIGTEITDPGHQKIKSGGPLVTKPGYIHVPEGTRYDWEVYNGKPTTNASPVNVVERAITGQIYAVNTGFLEVWWANTNRGAQWWSQVKRYDAKWPDVANKIVIAAYQRNVIEDKFRKRLIAPEQEDARLYVQNDRTKIGFNPNDEHALIDQGVVYALRDDLGAINSLPYTLLRYRGQQSNPTNWHYAVFSVVAEEEPYFFKYLGRAGTFVQQPLPISILPYCKENTGVSGPFWRDRKDSYWAMAAGNDDKTADIVMHWFYPAQADFYFPDAPNQRTGICVPWLDVRAKTPGVPIDVAYTIHWPDRIPDELVSVLGPRREVPALEVGETLINPKRGLPAVNGQCSAEIVYQQAVSNRIGESVHLIDPFKVRRVSLAALPKDVANERVGGKIVFNKLPPHLRERLTYDDLNKQLQFRGVLKTPAAGEPWLLPNIITGRERDLLLNPEIMGSDATFRGALSSLANAAKDAIQLKPIDTDFDGLALTAGFASGVGYVTLAFQNNREVCNEALPVDVQIIRVTCPLYRGYVRSVLSGSPFDEMITLRFDGDLAGKSDTYEFQWQTQRDEGGVPPADASPNWRAYTTGPANGIGAIDVTIAGAGIYTLSDNWFRCRYKPAPNGNKTCGADAWSTWTTPQLAEGWIKRVLAGINVFDQCFEDLADPTREINTLISMLSRAGKRWEGAVPLNTAKCDNYGLIEVYESVLKRGISFSIEGSPPTDDAAVNQALLLAAGRLADLYMLLGNEAYADASDPTVGVPTAKSENYQGAPSTIHAFMNITGGSSLLEEELSLLRGRDDSGGAPGIEKENKPAYNRLIWNFSRGDGQVAYKLNYDIRDQDGSFDGKLTEDDAKLLYPQGHGDAWGHYLTAIKNYYRLLRNPNYTWIPRAEAVQIGGVPVTVDYLDERKFLRAAAAKARTGAELVSLTYRSVYTEDPSEQWKGYKDPYESKKSSQPDAESAAQLREKRAWGVSDWGSRAGQGTFLDWVVGNAILPDFDNQHTGIQKIDRTTAVELDEIALTIRTIQSEVDKADIGLNPLGLVKNVLPFDINPVKIDAGESHFEQIYERAETALNNAIAVFNRASGNTQALRQQADEQHLFDKALREREQDYKSRMIELFGYPYPEDIGGAGAYPAGYDGPDIYHFSYVDPSELVGESAGISEEFKLRFKEHTADANNIRLPLQETNKTVTFHLSKNGFGEVKPPEWKGQRKAPGEIQVARSELIQAKARFDKAVLEYGNFIVQVEDQAALLKSQYDLNAAELRINLGAQRVQQNLNQFIGRARERQLDYQTRGRIAGLVANALAEGMPKVIGGGFSFVLDPTFLPRQMILMAGTITTEIMTQNSNSESLGELDHQQAKELVQSQTSIDLTSLQKGFAIEQQIKQLEQLIRSEAVQRLEIYSLLESMQQGSGRYMSAVARADRLREDFLRFRRETAADTADGRYKDMAYRIFRNDALQKYRAQFDLASAYVYMAARAYDWETGLLENDSRKPGQGFLSEIVRTRAIGLIEGGHAQTASSQGDPGLADPMARMSANWQTLKGQLGYYTPQREENRFSLRRELFRITTNGVAGNKVWRDLLRESLVPNILEDPRFQRYCTPFTDDLTNQEPAIVIAFKSNITAGQNFFGWPLAGNESSYSSALASTKIRGVGVWFVNYNTTSLPNTPRVYLFPIGDDIFRSPTKIPRSIRYWTVVDQALPAPFKIGIQDANRSDWIPTLDSLSGKFTDIRQFVDFRAYHDSGTVKESEIIKDSRLIGRSVWNTQWLLIIPAGTLSEDRQQALDTFIDGKLVNGKRDGNGVSDILLLFQSYATGN